MKRKKLETFMKSTCVALSAAMLVTSIPVNAAGVSENSVDTVTEVNTGSNSDTDTNADVDVKNEADNTEGTNTEVDTKSATDEEIVETDVETEDGQDNEGNCTFEGSNVNLFELDYKNISDSELNDNLLSCNDADIAAWITSLSENDVNELMQRDTILSQTLDYYGQDFSDINLVFGQHFETGFEYYKLLATSKNVKAYHWGSATGRITINFVGGPNPGSSTLTVGGIDTTKRLRNRQKALSYVIHDSKNGLRISQNSTYTWMMESNENEVREALSKIDAGTNKYVHSYIGIAYTKPVGYAVSAPSYSNVANGRYHLYYVNPANGADSCGTGYGKGVGIIGTALGGDTNYGATTEVWGRLVSHMCNFGINQMNDSNVSIAGKNEVITLTYTPAVYTATFNGVGAATWSWGGANALPGAPTAPKYSASFSDGGGVISANRDFGGWRCQANGQVYAPGTSFSQSFVSNVVFDPVWGNATLRAPGAPAAKKYTVHYDGNGGGIPQKAVDTSTVPFVSWGVKGVGNINAGAGFVVGGDTSAAANWGTPSTVTLPNATPTNYTVSFNTKGGNSIGSKTTNRKFKGWDGAGNAGAAYRPSGDVTLKAIWSDASVTLPTASKSAIVKYDANGGTSTKTEDKVSIPVVAWNDGSRDYLVNSTYSPTKNTDMSAKYGSTTVTLPTASKTGYTFKNWSVDAAKGSIAGNTLTVKNTDVTATANYTANTYTVKYSANGGNGEMADQAMTYDKDATLSDNVFTRDNYTFRGWSTDPNGSAMYTDKQSVKNLTAENGAVVTLYAVWTKNQYTINFDGNGGSVTTPSMVANMGEDVQLPTATKQYKVDFATNGGYLQNNASTSKIVDVEFRGWSTNKDFVEGTDKLYTGNEKDLPTVNVNGESVTTLYAVWGENPSIELPKAAKDGYTFVNWSFTKADGASDSIASGNIDVYSNMTITATWRGNGPTPTPTPTPSKDYTEEMKNILNILQNITTTQDLTSQQISQLTTLIKEVCFNDVDPAVVEKLVDMIKNSNLSESVKKAIFEALASGSISEDLKSTLIDAIKNSNLSEYEKSQLISAIEKMSTLSLDEQKKILDLLTQGSSVTYKIDGIEYILKKNADGTLTIGIKNLNGKENVVIPDSVTVAGVTTAVTEVSKEAFKNNTIIKTVTMGNNVTKIGDSAFEGCKNLKSVTIGPAVTHIGNKAFKGCTSLTKINIPKSVLKIGNNAFEGCSKLKTVTFHEGLLQIGNKAFYKCSALTKVKLPKSLLKAGSYAFSKCKKLKTVTFATDANVTTLGKGIFADNASFKTIKIPSKVTAISTKMFRNDKKLSKVTGLSGVTKINANAFENCKSLKTITLQKNVQTIGSKAFYNCSKLSKVTIKSNAVTSIGSKAFKKCKKAIKFKVPNSKVNTYKKLLKGKY